MDLAPVICSNCGTPNEAGRKFCSECGHGLGVACKVCGTLNAPSLKFCGECGSPMQADAAAAPRTGTEPSAERRLISVMLLADFRAAFVPLADAAPVPAPAGESRSRVTSA